MISEELLQRYMEKMLGDMGAASSASLILIGDRLGLYKALAEQGPMSSEELAERTGTFERYVREWLAAQAAAEYISYDPELDRYLMTPEQIAVFADEDSPFNMIGGYYGIASVFHDESRITDAFRTGAGIPWSEHHECLFCGTAKFFRPGYVAHLVQEWIPALDGVQEKLEQGGKMADIGCGHGISTIIMAKAFPHSQFHGFDYHDGSIRAARELARKEGLQNVTFEVATAGSFPGEEYDFITYFDCLHDMGDPVGAISHARQVIRADGTVMIVEPMAADSLAENLNPIGRIFYNFSTTVCTPNSVSQEVGLALGAQAGEKRLREVVTQGGFTRFRRATETPFNMILEAKP